jgi:hypothetical protein
MIAIRTKVDFKASSFGNKKKQFLALYQCLSIFFKFTLFVVLNGIAISLTKRKNHPKVVYRILVPGRNRTRAQDNDPD